MDSSLHSYLVNGRIARNKVRVKGIEILSPASLFSTDILFTRNFGIDTIGDQKIEILEN